MILSGNLFERHKQRFCNISKDYTSLHLIYQFTSCPYKREEIEVGKLYVFKSDPPGVKKIQYRFTDSKTLDLKLEIDKPDLNYLYKVVLSLAYVMGSNFTLSHFNKDFPFFPLTRYFNIGGSNPVTRVLFREFLRSPESVIAKINSLCEKKNSVFQAALATLLEVNAIGYKDIRFGIQYGLLEKLSANEKISGVIFSTSLEKKELEKFSNEVQTLLASRYSLLDQEPLRKKLSTDYLNQRGTSKEKIKLFLDKIDDPRIPGFINLVSDWAKIRNTTLVHGSSSSGTKLLKEKEEAARELQHLLLILLEYEYFSRRSV